MVLEKKSNFWLMQSNLDTVTNNNQIQNTLSNSNT